ncbi:hypothetical protein RQP46_006167 [Phenoliferia psychrophenolica]
MSDVPPATSSRLLCLPTELLAHIVELVHLQDLAYRARLEVPEKEDEEEEDEEVDTVWTRSWGGKTLSVVALVCKRLRELAVPHQFQVLSSSGVLEPLTRFHIIPHFAASFTSLQLDGSYGPALESTIALLATNLFPKLHHVEISAKSIVTLFDDGAASLLEDPPSPLASAFSTAFRTITSVQFASEITAQMAAILLSKLPAVEVLDISGLTAFDPDGALGGALSTLHHLRHLIIDFTIPSDTQLEYPQATPSSWVGDPWAASLRRLDVTVPSLWAQDWAFIVKFAPTLEHLSLDFDLMGSDSHGTVPDWSAGPTFLRLAHLHLVSEEEEDTDSLDVLDRLSDSPLRHFHYPDSLSNGTEALERFCALIAKIPTLRVVDTTGPDPPPLDAYEAISAACGQRGVDFRCASTASPYKRDLLDREVCEREFPSHLKAEHVNITEHTTGCDMSDVPPSTECRLLALPTELLAHIVELVHLQDLTYRARVSMPVAEEAGGKAVWTRSWGGKTLGVVALLCKRLRQLAVPHQFQTFSASEALDPFTRFHILPRFAASFTRVRFDGADGPALESTLSHLATKLFPKAHHVEFSAKSVVTLFGTGAALLLEDPPSPLASAFPAAFSTITSVKFASRVLASEAAAVLAKIPSVEVLDISGLTTSDPAAPSSWTTTQWAACLRRLDMKAPALGPDDWTFIVKFATTVEHLSLKFECLRMDEDDNSEPNLSSGPAFPRLVYLDLDVETDESLDILSRLRNSPLQHIVCREVLWHGMKACKRLFAIIADIPTLKKVTTTTPNSISGPIPLQVYKTALDSCASRGLEFHGTSATSPYKRILLCPDRNMNPADELEAERLGIAAHTARALEWGLRQTRKAEAEGNLDDSTTLLKLTRRLEAERVAMLE